MAPEQEARERAFYDHESDEPRRRRRPAADWGVGEDIFDRMPSRRLNRRAEHREVVLRRGGEPAPGSEAAATAADATLRREVAIWSEEDAPRADAAARTGEEERAPRRPVESWLDDEARPLVQGESRTIVLARGETGE